MSTTQAPPRTTVRPTRSTRRGSRASLVAHGEPLVWLTGGALAVALSMIVGLLALICMQGLVTFWPRPLVELKTADGAVFLGEVSASETYAPDESVLEPLEPVVAARARAKIAEGDGIVRRRLMRTGNFDLTNSHFHWVPDFLVEGESSPVWAVLLEREEWGNFYGFPKEFRLDGNVVAKTHQDVWAKFGEFHDSVRKRYAARRKLEIHAIGEISRQLRASTLDLREVERREGRESEAWRLASAAAEQTDQELTRQSEDLRAKIAELNRENDRYAMVLTAADGTEKSLNLADVVRAIPSNQLSFSGALSVYLSRWGEFLTANPRNSNSEGGVFPAMFGTVVMTLIMSLLVAPFGVLAALYLREYAKSGAIVSAVRIAINNLAGVPSIVFGVFGLGFFCYIVGGRWIDPWLFSARLPEDPTYGKGTLLWASLTLALLTLPVVIVATEEALAAVPRSMREGSYACGASKWQTIRRIVLPRAMPGIMTGMILAMSRGAGEVAPLMLVGAARLAEDLPIDSVFPFLHPERKFMHLGFQIYDLGFQAQNSEAAKPMVFTTTLLLIAIITFLNLTAIYVRTRLWRRFASNQF